MLFCDSLLVYNFCKYSVAFIGFFCARTGSDMVTTVAGVYDIMFGMRRCRINLPNRCYHLISRVAYRALEWGKRRIERVAPL